MGNMDLGEEGVGKQSEVCIDLLKKQQMIRVHIQMKLSFVKNYLLTACIVLIVLDVWRVTSFSSRFLYFVALLHLLILAYLVFSPQYSTPLQISQMVSFPERKDDYRYSGFGMATVKRAQNPVISPFQSERPQKVDHKENKTLKPIQLKSLNCLGFGIKTGKNDPHHDTLWKTNQINMDYNHRSQPALSNTQIIERLQNATKIELKQRKQTIKNFQRQLNSARIYMNQYISTMVNQQTNRLRKFNKLLNNNFFISLTQYNKIQSPASDRQQIDLKTLRYQMDLFLKKGIINFDIRKQVSHKQILQLANECQEDSPVDSVLKILQSGKVRPQQFRQELLTRMNSITYQAKNYHLGSNQCPGDNQIVVACFLVRLHNQLQTALHPKLVKSYEVPSTIKQKECFISRQTIDYMTHLRLHRQSGREESFPCERNSYCVIVQFCRWLWQCCKKQLQKEQNKAFKQAVNFILQKDKS